MNKLILDQDKTKSFIEAETGDIWITHKWSDGVESVVLSPKEALELARAILGAVQ